MQPIRKELDFGGGVTVSILVTPALYSVAKRRGIDLVADGNAGDIWSSYVKMLYCAAILAWEVDAVDNPGNGEFPYKFQDIHAWAWADTQRLAETVSFMYEALTGKPLKDAATAVKKNGSPGA